MGSLKCRDRTPGRSYGETLGMIASPGGKLSAQLTEEECGRRRWMIDSVQTCSPLRRDTFQRTRNPHAACPNSSPGSFGPTLPPGEGIDGAWVAGASHPPYNAYSKTVNSQLLIVNCQFSTVNCQSSGRFGGGKPPALQCASDILYPISYILVSCRGEVGRCGHRPLPMTSLTR